MALRSVEAELFGQMKKKHSSPSQNQEWPSAHKRRRFHPWALALVLGLAVVASASISLNANVIMKYLKLSSEKESAVPSFSDDKIGEILPAENNANSPLLKTQRTSGASGVLPVPWNANVNLNLLKQESSLDSSTSATDAQPLPKRENETPSQGSESVSGESAALNSQSLIQTASIAIPSPPAIGRIPPVRPPPTPTPTPYPIRSPQ